MGKSIKLLTTIVLIVVFLGCQKDYPTDIPNWLEERIKAEKKECRKGVCHCESSGACLLITEYELNNNDIIYEFTTGSGGAFYYDYNGNFMCDATSTADCNTCFEYDICDKKKIRVIWDQEP
ncbi:MAG: hypothetical protein HUJ25_03510 [Crocinitomicaceae bacterium]|nr:hypothetical protein [Crocinitomicaceae bacterium]